MIANFVAAAMGCLDTSLQLSAFEADGGHAPGVCAACVEASCRPQSPP